MTECTPFDSPSDEELDDVDVDVDEMFGTFLIDSQCQFINTIGMCCPNSCQDSFECCPRHRCSYIHNGKQCRKVVSCQHQWYCIDHGKICRYQYIDNIQCQNTVYYYAHKTGSNYCNRHQCWFPGCRQLIDVNNCHLCTDHYTRLHFVNM